LDITEDRKVLSLICFIVLLFLSAPPPAGCRSPPRKRGVVCTTAWRAEQNQLRAALCGDRMQHAPCCCRHPRGVGVVRIHSILAALEAVAGAAARGVGVDTAEAPGGARRATAADDVHITATAAGE